MSTTVSGILSLSLVSIDIRCKYSSDRKRSSGWSVEWVGRSWSEMSSKFLCGCPPSLFDVIFRCLALSLSPIFRARQPRQRATFCGQRHPHTAVVVDGRLSAHARRPSWYHWHQSSVTAARRWRRSLASEVCSVTVAQVAAMAPLTHRLAVDGQCELGAICVRHFTTVVYRTTVMKH